MENKFLPQENGFISNVCSNTKSDVIIITEDKLRLIFGKFVNRIKKTRDWISYAGNICNNFIKSINLQFR